MSTPTPWLLDPNPRSRLQSRAAQAWLSWLRFRRADPRAR